IPMQYDPLLAKLVVHAQTRELAMDKMIRAIGDYQISGLETTLDFGKFVMQHPAFREGNFNTRFIENYFKPEMLKKQADKTEEQLAAALAFAIQQESKPQQSTVAAPAASVSKWRKNRV
ncbi:MAG: biotin carboxylase, partial [Cytophagales bacterium]